MHFSPDGRLLAVAEGFAAHIIDVGSWDKVRSVAHDGLVTSARFTSSGRRLVTGSWDGAVGIWNPDTGAQEHRIEIGWRVADVGVDAEERVVGVGGDGGAGLWSLESGEHLATLAGHSAQVLAVRFAPDGRTVATGSIDGAIRVWSLSLDELVGLAGRNVTRSLTDAECRQYLHVDVFR